MKFVSCGLSLLDVHAVAELAGHLFEFLFHLFLLLAEFSLHLLGSMALFALRLAQGLTGFVHSFAGGLGSMLLGEFDIGLQLGEFAIQLA